MFHLLIDEAVRFLVGGKREALRRQLARAFEHGRMEQAARAFAAPSAGQNPWRAALSGPRSQALAEIADAFIFLQEQRHAADYDLARTFKRSAVLAIVARAQDAFALWAQVRGTEEAEAFLRALLVKGRS